MGEEELRTEIEELAARISLSEYEREAYLTILSHGSLPVSELAEQTDIPQPRIYDTVRDLEDRGLVEVHESRPMRVIAVDPKESFEEVATTLDRVIDQLQTRFTSPAPTEAAVSLLTSAATIRRNVRDVIEAAQYELSLALDPELVASFEPVLRAANERGVSTELIVSPAAELSNVDSIAFGEIATAVRSRRGRTTPIIAVADGHRSIFATRESGGRARDRYGVLFNRSALGFLLNGFYGTVLWTTAEPVFEESSVPELPRRYASVRRCIKDISTIDTDLHVEVEGRWVESDRACHISGRVSETALEEGRQVATVTVESEEGTIHVGGRLAAYEDVEAHRLDLFARADED